MIKPEHLRSLISDTLDTYFPKMNTPEAIELLMMTAAQESHCGRYLKQEGANGVALGIFQIEPATYQDLHWNFLRYHESLTNALYQGFHLSTDTFDIHLRGNLVFQIVVARLQYYRFPERIPTKGTATETWEYLLARYYKKYWNTELGAATIPEVLRNYDKYAK